MNSSTTTEKQDKVTELDTAIANHVNDGDSIYLAGFTHLIPFASGHEIIRQGFTDLHLIRATPDLIYDQMIAAGCASKITFSWAGNPGVGSLRAFRRAIEDSVPSPLEIDEYTHFGLTSRLAAGARGLPFMPVKTFQGSDLMHSNDNIRTVENPFGDGEIPVVPPLCPDVAVVRAQRADTDGNAHIWGIQGEIPEVVHAAENVILSVEELVSERVIRSDPNRTVVPGSAVDAVVVEPYGSHPSYAQGHYDRDNDSYLEWNEVSESHARTKEWLDEWVYDVSDRQEYVEKLGSKRLLELQVPTEYATPINMGDY